MDWSELQKKVIIFIIFVCGAVLVHTDLWIKVEMLSPQAVRKQKLHNIRIFPVNYSQM